jgi:hypothetical protein
VLIAPDAVARRLKPGGVAIEASSISDEQTLADAAPATGVGAKGWEVADFSLPRLPALLVEAVDQGWRDHRSLILHCA